MRVWKRIILYDFVWMDLCSYIFEFIQNKLQKLFNTNVIITFNKITVDTKRTSLIKTD